MLHSPKFESLQLTDDADCLMNSNSKIRCSTNLKKDKNLFSAKEQLQKKINYTRL